VTKPFTPEEISKVVHEHLRGAAADESNGHRTDVAAENWVPAAEGFFFWHDSWVQQERDGSVRVGAMTSSGDAATIRGVRLPKLGETVYQGLPLAAIDGDGPAPRLIAAPLSGVVVAVNGALADNPKALWEHPCGGGWLAAVSPTRYEEEIERCLPRRVILFNADAASARVQQEGLAGLGCHVRLARNWEEIASPLQDKQFGVVLIDAASLGNDGPALVARINSAAPAAKLVLVATDGSAPEAAYRAHRLFYYAVEPFADGEIVAILQAAFGTNGVAHAENRNGPVADAPVATINLVSRNGTKVRLMPEGGLLQRDAGLGRMIRQRLLERLLPIETTQGHWIITPSNIVKVAATCDRVVVLMAREADRLPGSLVRDTKGEFVAVAGADVGNVTTLVVQPVTAGHGVAGLDDATLAILAEHIVNDLVSY
jgi:glycine cleavage system H protein